MIKHFPKQYQPYPQQIEAIVAIEDGIKSGKRFIVLDAPVGSGKSQVALTVANWSKNAYILMPRRDLQQQYRTSFDGDIRLVQGRSSIPCTYQQPELNRKVIKLIETGGRVPQPSSNASCSTAPCMNVRSPKRKQVIDECANSGKCPYTATIEEACKHSVVVANNHSFYYGALNGNLPKRKVLVVDEAHNLVPLIRELVSVSFVINRKVLDSELVGMKTPQQFVNWFKFDEQFLTVANDKREEYLAKLEKFEKAGESVFGKQAIVKIIVERGKTTFEFTPTYIGGAAHSFFFDFADIIVLMSGTVYDLAQFCNPLGLKVEDVHLKRLVSDFPIQNRPIVLPRNPNLDLSHARWNENVEHAVLEIKRIMQHHKDTKGLIHSPNYRLAKQLSEALADTGRVITHHSENFSERLQAFYDSKEPKVFISPAVREGYDFKDSHSRFQILIRPPNPPIDDPYNKWLLSQGRWDLYYRIGLTDFGQMLGRPVRSKDDFAVTYLLSSTFSKFLNKVWSQIPEWQRKAFVK